MKYKRVWLASTILAGSAFSLAAQHWTSDSYLQTQMNGIQLSATTCPGGGNRPFVVGTRPDVDRCVNVSYRASCPGPQHAYVEGQIKNYVGGASCYGDSHKMDPGWLKCSPEEMKVWLTDVTYCN